ncbi:hypothetical protein AaE_003298 [Aphanomyces astaci]|uniref:Uncharacterized protein n=1 Tax=Aphanomyces astaci TaxID=112090 RepID=A0A6A5ASG9_APHAT|nr:hypothetical protein AaE_003298 [Aphanomyces astaci]
MRALERDDQAWVLDQEGKTVVDIMVKAIKPHWPAEVCPKLAGPPTQQAVEGQRYAPVEDEKTPAPSTTAAAAPSRPSKPGRSEGSGGPPRRAPDPEQDSTKYERMKATFLKCASDNHKVMNCPKCVPGESERLLKKHIDKWESA